MNLNEMITHLNQNAPQYVRRMADAGLKPEDIHTLEDLNRLPVMSKDEVIALQAEQPPFGGMLACRPSELKRIFQSPGPIYEPEARVDDYWRVGRSMRAAGFEPGDLVLNAFSYHLTPAGAMFEEGLRAAGCTIIPGGVGSMEQQIELVCKVEASGYVGLPSYLKAMFDKADELGLELPFRKAALGAEPLLPAQRAAFKARGLVARQGYGTAECGILGYECEREEGWHIPDDVIVQICDINSGQPLPPGEVGQVVATLYNPYYALIRFGVGDLSAIHPQPCECGRPSQRLVGWLGRVGAAVKVRGMFLHPSQVARFVGRFPEVQAHQSVITRDGDLDQLTLRIIVRQGADPQATAENIRKAAREALKFRLEVESVTAQDLPPDSPPLLDERSWV